MRGNGARRVFLIALAACFALLCFLFARRSVDVWTSVEREYPRVNAALTLSLEEDGVIRVEGEGKLHASDLKALIKTAGIRSQDVNDIIVGDGITQIGYLTFNRMKYLRTLKLGEGVTQMAPGALRYCSSLEWLYLPSGLKELGEVFLLGCDKCRVVTDAPREALPPLDNVEKSKRIIAEVDSLDALRAAVRKRTELPDALAHWWR